jgi:Cu/Ag efflux protein CusF
MKQKLKLSVVAAAALASVASFAQQDQSSPESANPGAQTAPNAAAYGGRAVTVRGTIESVDRVTRTMSIKGEDGRIAMIRLGEKMPNPIEFEKGDKVTARYSEAMLVSIARSDASPQVQSQATQKSPNSEQPAVQSVQHTSVVAQVTNVDRDARRITLEAPNGEEIQLGVRDADAMRDLKIGDKVVANYIEAFALSIEPQDSSGQATGGARQRDQ